MLPYLSFHQSLSSIKNYTVYYMLVIFSNKAICGCCKVLNIDKKRKDKTPHDQGVTSVNNI
jgi:hypothetical protein